MKIINVIDIWVKSNEEPGAITKDGEKLTLIVRLVDGFPIFIRDNIYIEKREISAQQFQQLKNYKDNQ